jgi:hypothetical protein
LHELSAHGLVQEPAAAAARVTVSATLEEGVAGAEYVQECGPEVLDVKRSTFEQLDRAAPPNASSPRPPPPSSPRSSPRASPGAHAASSRIR